MDIKKFGDNLEINGFVIHQLSKIANDRNVALKKAKTVIAITDKEKVFIGKINHAYHKKSSPTYGIFAGSNPGFRISLESYLDEDKFYEFSVKAATQYKAALENTISATGGFLIFTDFVNTETNSRYMLILTINNKDGYVVSESDLTLKDIKNLDIGKIDIACMINLSRWQDIERGESSESKTYLSFIRGNKNVSYYFLTFIDCDNKTTNTESSKRLTSAIDAYSKQKGYNRKDAIILKNAVYDYCIGCMDNKKEIQLSSISALVNPDNVNDFLEFAASEEFGVSETIKGDKAQLRRIKYIMYKDSNYTVEFDADLLGKDVIYNKQKNELTFKRVPEALAKQIPS